MGELKQYRHSMMTEEATGIIYYIQQSEIDTGSELEGYTVHLSVWSMNLSSGNVTHWFCRAVNLSGEPLQLDS